MWGKGTSLVSLLCKWCVAQRTNYITRRKDEGANKKQMNSDCVRWNAVATVRVVRWIGIQTVCSVNGDRLQTYKNSQTNPLALFNSLHTFVTLNSIPLPFDTSHTQ